MPGDDTARPVAATLAPGGAAGVGITLHRSQFAGSVADLRSGSPAARSGIELGDRVVSIDGARIGALETDAEALPAGAAGPSVMIVVNRNGMQRVFTLERRGNAARR